MLHRVACLRQPRELLLSPRAIGFSLSLGPGEHIAAQAPSFRALNFGVGAHGAPPKLIAAAGEGGGSEDTAAHTAGAAET